MGGDKIASLVDKDYTVALFELLSKFPLSDITSGLAILLIFYSLSQVSTQQRILLEWLLEAVRIQNKTQSHLGLINWCDFSRNDHCRWTNKSTNASVVTGLPFSIILLLMTISIMRALRREHTKHFQMSYVNDDKDYSIPLENAKR